MTTEPATRARVRDLRDAALGACFLLFALALVLYELRGTYRDLLLWRRGTASFAYVTRARSNWASKNGSRSDRCDLEAMIPNDVQTHEPRALPNMNGARYFNSNEPDGDRKCLDLLHTWQPVLFDPDDRAHARFTWGLEESTNGIVGIGIGIVGLALAALIFRGIQRLRARRARAASS